MHSDHGFQYTSWAFTSRVHEAGLIASMGSVGDCYDNAMMESFWSGMQIEVLDSQPGPPDRNWERRCSPGSKPGTIPADVTPAGLPLTGGLGEDRPDELTLAA